MRLTQLQRLIQARKPQLKSVSRPPFQHLHSVVDRGTVCIRTQPNYSTALEFYSEYRTVYCFEKMF